MGKRNVEILISNKFVEMQLLIDKLTKKINMMQIQLSKQDKRIKELEHTNKEEKNG